MVKFDEIQQGDEFVIAFGDFRGRRVRASRCYTRDFDNPKLIEFEIWVEESDYLTNQGYELPGWVGFTSVNEFDRANELRVLQRIPWMISIYECDRAYGGPEEGGWWYDTGELRRTLKRQFRSREDARAAVRRVNGWLDRMRPDNVRIGSVIYSGGHYEARIHPEGAQVEYWPASRPHYE